MKAGSPKQHLQLLQGGGHAQRAGFGGQFAIVPGGGLVAALREGGRGGHVAQAAVGQSGNERLRGRRTAFALLLAVRLNVAHQQMDSRRNLP